MSKLIKFSLVAVLSLGLIPNTSFAQEADDDVEEVIVTGSKIKKSVFDSSKPDGNPRKLLDSSLINNLGWTAKTNLKDGLNSTYKWYLSNIS